MKKSLFLTAALLLTIRFANAQTQAGNQNIGLNFSFSTSSSNDEAIDPTSQIETPYGNKNNAFSLGPAYSYFIKNNVDLGASFSYSTDNQNYNAQPLGYPSTNNNSNFSAMVYLRRYFLFNDKFGFRFGPYLEYGRQKTSEIFPPADNTYNYTSATNSMYAGLNLGLVYYPAKHLGLATALADVNYQHYSASGSQSADNGGSFNLSLFTSGLELSVFYIF